MPDTKNADLAIDKLVAQVAKIRKAETRLAKVDAEGKKLRKAIATDRDALEGLVLLNDPESAPLFNQDGTRKDPDDVDKGDGVAGRVGAA